MNETSDLAEIQAQHAALQQEIDAESRRPRPDQLRLTSLKREKLRLKEKLVLRSSAGAAPEPVATSPEG
ncbi:MAG: YdcH family protein [Proteobacteria bacterium]|nr:YdcH family protein [Pseudomonadota bacterium]